MSIATEPTYWRPEHGAALHRERKLARVSAGTAYAAPSSSRETKARRANEILDTGDVALSAQVLQEFYVQATRPSRARPLRQDEAVGFVETLLGFPVQETTVAIVLAAMATRERFGISYWDATILEAARAAGCDIVLSEDLAHGTDYAGVTVENPFADLGRTNGGRADGNRRRARTIRRGRRRPGAAVTGQRRRWELTRVGRRLDGQPSGGTTIDGDYTSRWRRPASTMAFDAASGYTRESTRAPGCAAPADSRAS